MNIIIGADGGGTKTNLVAVGLDGEMLGGCTGRGINFNTIGMQRARAVLSALIKKLIRQVGADGAEAIYIGMSALYDTPSREITKLFCEGALPVERVVMCSDIIAALYGLTLGAPGVITVSGTGMMGASVDAGGRLEFSGGWGYLLNDEGSCYFIGLEGIKAALSDMEGSGINTILTGRLLEFYKTTDSREFLQYLYSNDTPTQVISYFAQEVLAAYRKQDAVACDIIENTVDILVSHTVRLVNKIDIRPLKVGVYGGLFEKNADILSLFKRKIHCTHPDIQAEIPLVPPEVGAIIYGLGIKKPKGYEKIKKRLSSYYTAEQQSNEATPPSFN